MKWFYFTRSNGDVDSMPFVAGISTLTQLKEHINNQDISRFSIQESCGVNPTWDGEKYVSDTSKQIKQEAEEAYLSARADTTVVWTAPDNSQHTFRWHKPRHWEDWHRLLTTGLGAEMWYDEDDQPVPLTHTQMLEITLLIALNHKQAHAAYWQATRS